MGGWDSFGNAAVMLRPRIPGFFPPFVVSRIYSGGGGVIWFGEVRAPPWFFPSPKAELLLLRKNLPGDLEQLWNLNFLFWGKTPSPPPPVPLFQASGFLAIFFFFFI
jgi:hypothetical protein